LKKTEAGKISLPENSIAPAPENFSAQIPNAKSEALSDLNPPEKILAENAPRRPSVLPEEETDFPL
jgi:hypothetical protein